MHSLANRLIALFSSIIIVVLLLTGWSLSRAVETHFADMDRAVLQTMITTVVNQLHAQSDPLTDDQIHDILDNALEGSVPVAIIVKDPQHHNWDASYQLSLSNDLIQRNWPIGLHKWTDEQTQVRTLAQSIQIKGKAWQIIAIQSIHHHVFFMEHFYQMLGLSLLIAVIMAILLSYIVIHRALHPLNALANSMMQVSVHDLLDQRLTLPNTIEMRKLAEAYNAMLNRLADAFSRLKDFAADLAHELRSPLNALRLQTEVTLSKPRTAMEYEDALASTQQDLLRLSKTVDEMLFLAKADKGLMPLDVKPTQLKALLNQLANYFLPITEEKHQQIIINGEAERVLDVALIKRAFANLLSNAVEHAPINDLILITITNTPAHTTLITFENSATLDEQSVARLFDRFWRQDPARSHDNHLGLGLAIVKSIIELHGGHVRAQIISGRLQICCEL